VANVSLKAYKFEADPDEECSVNTIMLERSIRAVEKLSSKLSYVVLPSGTKVLTQLRNSNSLPVSLALC
jgi:hypothetical protein